MELKEQDTNFRYPAHWLAAQAGRAGDARAKSVSPTNNAQRADAAATLEDRYL
jgi:hypothetical protein